jgi:hypothetical protein
MLFSRSQAGSIKRIEAEKARFDTVLQQASDEELIIVLKYGIIHHYVPTYDIDPCYDLNVVVGPWYRTLKVYEKLEDRKDLLGEIFPDLKVLDDYVNWNEYVVPFTDTIAAQAIIHNAQKHNGHDVDSLMETGPRRSSLKYKYFGVPML